MASIIRSPQLSKDTRKLVSPRLHVEESIESITEALLIEKTTTKDETAKTNELIQESIEKVIPCVDELISRDAFLELQQKLKDATTQADTAEQELARLRDQLSDLKFEAREQGYVAGFEEAKEKADLDVKEQIDMLGEISKNLLTQFQDVLKESEADLVEVAYAAVARIIGNVLVDPESVATVVRDVAKQMTDERELTVKLSDLDYKMINDYGVSLFGETERANKVRIVADSSIQLGGCILETEKGSLDARLEVQLERLKQVLLEAHACRALARKAEKDAK